MYVLINNCQKKNKITVSFCTERIFLEFVRFVSSIGQAFSAPLHVEQIQWLKEHWPFRKVVDNYLPM